MIEREGVREGGWEWGGRGRERPAEAVKGALIAELAGDARRGPGPVLVHVHVPLFDHTQLMFDHTPLRFDQPGQDPSLFMCAPV